MYEEKEPKNAMELTDDELDAISGGIIVSDEVNGKTVYTVYDSKGKLLSLPGQTWTNLSDRSLIEFAKKHNAYDYLAPRETFNYYLKNGEWPKKKNKYYNYS